MAFDMILHAALLLLGASRLAAPSTAVAFTRLHTINSQPTSRPLEDLELRCCVLLAPPYAYKDTSRYSLYNGWSVQHFELLQERTGFRCRSIQELDDEDGSPYNSFVERMVSCTNENGTVREDSNCKCDIGIGSWVENIDRAGVDFLPSHGYDSFVVITHENNTHELVFGLFFIHAFTPNVWFAILCLFLTFLGLKVLDPVPVPSGVRQPERSGPWRRWKFFLLKNPGLYALRRAVQDTANWLLPNAAVPIPQMGNPRKHWLLNFLITVCGLFLFLVYEATMTASMVSDTTASAFRTVEDFTNGKIAPSDVCFNKGDVTELFWKNVMKNDARGDMTEDEAIESVRNGECKFMLTWSGMGERIVNVKDCGTLVKTGDPFMTRGVSFVVPHNYPHTPALRKATLELQGASLVPTIPQYVQQQRICPARARHQLTPMRLYLFFTIVLAACTLIFLEMVFDRRPDSGLQDSDAV